ncbi:23S rRNA (guanosine(2251)-2'-O)-methyltransferase RlmB [Balneolaceae bacterium ANBcel3]|nr:23S rRNA (guanosine(2251)-2'-O)-methyltransferase RlmB [Balneolaceae bacterium ANBcel3]
MSDNECIYGRNAVREMLTHQPDRVTKLYIREHTKGSTIREIEDLASAGRIPVQTVPGRKLNDLVGSVNDQGVVAMISATPYLSLEEWLETIDTADNPVIIALDEVEDPHNFGAIIRTAAAAGVRGILVPKHRQAPVSGAVMKASAGAAGRIPVIRAGNLKQSLQMLKDAGFWVCGTSMDAKTRFWDQRYDMPLVLVIGGEDKGIRKKTRDYCDMFVHIPMQNQLESLNASVSCALVCYEVLRQRKMKPE